jgi:hypothetical protein
MRKISLTTFILIALGWQVASAQFGFGFAPRIGIGGLGVGSMRTYGNSSRRYSKSSNQPKFTPIYHFSLGYGFSNLDKSQLINFSNLGLGISTQSGPIIGAFDCQYSRNAAIGLLISHEKVNGSYYDLNYIPSPLMATGSLDNWSIMLNMMNYMPAGENISPFIRTAIGMNFWSQQYIDANANLIPVYSDPSQLAYQLSLGANIHLSKNTGILVEAGYGKYILHVGLTYQLNSASTSSKK